MENRRKRKAAVTLVPSCNELILSDVHISGYDECESEHCQEDGSYKVVKTRFEFLMPSTSSSDDEEEAERDEDGDLIVRRRSRAKKSEVIWIQHTLATRLTDVGQQVWVGCLLLCDYLLANRETFSDRTILELGCGVGLASAVARVAGAEHIIATDCNERALGLCEANFFTNFGAEQARERFRVKYLNWQMPKKPRTGTSAIDWTDEDLALLENVTHVIAADVIYDDTLTEAFFDSLLSLSRHIAQRQQRTISVIITLERRVNFSLHSLEVVTSSYDTFVEILHELKRRLGWQVEKLDTTAVPIAIQLSEEQKADETMQLRSEYLELWKLESSIEQR